MAAFLASVAVLVARNCEEEKPLFVVDAYYLSSKSIRPQGTAQQKLVRPLFASRETRPSSPSSSSTTATIKNLSSFNDINRIAAFNALFRTTVQPLVLFIGFSMALAFGLVAWEDYGALNLWPSRHMIVSTTSIDSNAGAMFGMRTVHGMGFGQSQRLKILLQEDNQNTALLPEIRSYNEVMKHHRSERVRRWQNIYNEQLLTREEAVMDLQEILFQVLGLQKLVKDYQWESVHAIIQDDILPKLEPAATTLRVQLDPARNHGQYSSLDYNVAYEEIGFDWGSCAWRHCGALADAQEALDELDHLLGILEPPECLFCLDVVERSIRDMLAVVPSQYHALDGIPSYEKYESIHANSDDPDFGDETDVLDQEYLRMLQELRRDVDSDE